jgi:hypothetical protein
MVRQILILFSSLCISTFSIADSAIFTMDYSKPQGHRGTFGFGYYDFKEDKLGLYMNLSLAMRGSNHYESLGINSFGDPIQNRYKESLTFNIGATKEVTKYIGIYAGIGFTSIDGIARKYDSSHILSSSGYYSVSDPANDSSGFNTNAGFIITTSPVSFNLGYNSFTKTAYIGIGFKATGM